MIDINKLIETVYAEAYHRGFHQHRKQTPRIGSGPKEIDSVPDPNHDFTEKLDGSLDSNHLFYVERTGRGTSRDNFYYDFSGSKSLIEMKKKFGPRSGTEVFRCPEEKIGAMQESIDEMESRIEELQQIVDALAATHPEASPRFEVEEDLESVDFSDISDWELEVDDENEGEVEKKLRGDHVFDHAVVSYTPTVSAVSGEKGTVNLDLRVRGVDLVSNN